MYHNYTTLQRHSIIAVPHTILPVQCQRVDTTKVFVYCARGAAHGRHVFSKCPKQRKSPPGNI